MEPKIWFGEMLIIWSVLKRDKEQFGSVLVNRQRKQLLIWNKIYWRAIIAWERKGIFQNRVYYFEIPDQIIDEYVMNFEGWWDLGEMHIKRTLGWNQERSQLDREATRGHKRPAKGVGAWRWPGDAGKSHLICCRRELLTLGQIRDWLTLSQTRELMTRSHYDLTSRAIV